jgi:hypothetical protein
MSRESVGLGLMAVGAGCVLFYVLASPRGVSATLVRAGGVALYFGIASLLAGAALRLSSGRGRVGRDG